MAGPQADLGGTRLPRRKVKRTPAPAPFVSSSAGGRGPQRGKPDAIQERRRRKGQRQGARLTRQNTTDTQPSGRARGRQQTPTQEAIAAIRADRVYGDTERAQTSAIRERNVLERAQRQVKAREDAKPSTFDKAMDVLDTKIPYTENTVIPGDLSSAVDVLRGKDKSLTVGDVAMVPGVKAAKVGGKVASLAKTGAKRKAGTVAQAVGKKAPKTAAKIKKTGPALKSGAKKVGKSKPAKPVKAVGKEAKKAYRSKPATPIRVATKASAENPGKVVGASLLSPGAVQTARTGDSSKLTAPIEGTVKGVIEDPKRTAATTAHSIIGMVPAAKGVIENTGLSAIRLERSGLEKLGLPGGKDYSGREIADPTRATGEAIKDFAKRYVDVYGSGDVDKIAKATQEEFGVGMALPLLGAARARGVKLRKIAENPEVGLARPVRVRGKNINVPGKKLKKRRELKADERELQRGARQAVNSTAVSKQANKDLGLTGKKRRVKGDIEIKRPDGTVEKMGAEDLVPVIVDEGATKPEHVFEAAEKRNTPDGASVATGRLTKSDAAQLLRENPRLWDDPRVQKAVQTIREGHPRDTDSLTKVLESSRVTAGIRHPWERYTEQREQILRRDPRGRFDAEDPDQMDLLVEEGGLEPHTVESLRDLNRKAEDEANAETLEWLEKTGRANPVFMRSIDAESVDGRPTAGSIGASPHGTGKRPVSKIGQYKSEAILNKRGTEDVSWRTFEGKTLYESRAAPVLNATAADFLTTRAQTFPILTKDGKVRKGGAEKGVVLSDKQLDNWVKAEIRAGRDPSRFIFLDAQTGKAAFYDKRAQRHDYGEDFGDFTETIREGFDRVAAERDAGITKGQGFIGLEKTHAEAFLAHYGRMGNWKAGLTQTTVPVQRFASKAILGYSPSWLIAQPIAETMQGLMAVGPINQIRGHKLYKSLDKETQRKIDALAGGAIGTGSIDKTLQDIAKGLKAGEEFNMSHAWGRTRAQLAKTPEGRFVDSLLSGRGASMIDKKKAGIIRRNVMMGHMVREYQTFSGSLRRIVHGQDNLDARMKGMSARERAKFITENPKAAAKIEGYLDDVMGNWTALTQSEKALSGVIIFYPFVRMAAEWVALTYPARHPLKAASLQFLGQMNANEVERLLGGRPSFLSGYAYNGIRAGEDGEMTSMSPLGPRVAIGSNPLIEAAGSDAGLVRGSLGAVNPVFQAAASAIGGYDPLTGRSQLGKYETLPLDQAIGSFAATLAKMPAPIRVFDEFAIPGLGFTGQRHLRDLAGKDDSSASKAFRSIDEEQGNRFLRKIFPGIPVRTALEREKAEVGRLMSRAYALPQDFDIDAAIAKARHDLEQGKGDQAQAELVKVYDSIIAYNRLERFYKQKGVAEESTQDKIKSIVEDFNIPKDQAEALVYGQSKMTPLIKGKADIATQAEAAGIPLKRIRFERRKRARKIMGYNDSVADGKARRASR